MRPLRRHLAYVACATLSVALTVGATLVVFSIVNALWLRPLPFPDPERIVIVTGDSSFPEEAAIFAGVERSDVWHVFESVAGQVVTSGIFTGLTPRVSIPHIGDPETVGVTPQYFRTLGLQIRGRDFTRDDDQAGAEPVAIISDRLWARAFARSPDTIGSVVAASPLPLRIVGVAPPGFSGARRGERADVWIPGSLVTRVAAAGDISEDSVPMLVIGRLRQGQTVAEAKRRLAEGDKGNTGFRIFARTDLVPLDRAFGTPWSRTLVISEGRPAAVVSALAGLVLVAGCVTLMALVLVHYERRKRELAVRLALGASRARLAAELSRELTWIAAGGSVGAVLMSFWSLRALPALTLPGGVDLGQLDLSTDWRVLAVGLGLTLLTLTMATALPIARFTRERLAGELVGATATTSASSQRLRQALLAIHVAATVVVLVAAGLFVRAVQHGFSAGPGFDIDRTLFVHLQLASPLVGDDVDIDARAALMNTRRRMLEEGLRAMSGVEVVSAGAAPLGPVQASLTLPPRTVAVNAVTRDVEIGTMTGSPDLMSALGVPLLAGRRLAADDARSRPRPVLVTQSLARAFWPDEDPLGQVLRPAPPGPGASAVARGRFEASEVVGVVADFAHGTMADPPAGVIVGVRATDRGMLSDLVVRTNIPDRLRESIRRLVQDVIPEVTRLEILTGRELVAQDLGRQRLGAWFFSGFGLIALLLGAAGVFGLVAYLAESGRREFGVRLALGATQVHLMRGGISVGLLPVIAGLAAGLLAAGLVARLLASVLPGLSPLDPVTYTGVAFVMLACALVAALTAAWRLRRIAPAEALRAE